MGLNKGQTNSGSFKKGCTSWSKGTIGIVKPNKTSFKKGQIPWNKGKKGLQKAWNWNGGKKTFHQNNARKNIEEKIGRKLKKEETVHHIDLNRKNNVLSNLQLFKNRGEHMQHHWALRGS